MKQLIEMFKKIENYLCIGAFIIMVLASFLQVTNRNIFRMNISCTEEVARYSMIWMALLGTQIGLREGKQMSVEFFVNRLNKISQKIVEIFGDIVCFLFSVITFYYSIDLLKMQYESHQNSAALGIPMIYISVVVSICFFVMSISKLMDMYYHITNKSTNENYDVEGGTL